MSQGFCMFGINLDFRERFSGVLLLGVVLGTTDSNKGMAMKICAWHT